MPDETRYIFHQKLCDMIHAEYERKKLEIDADDPKAIEKRSALSDQCLKDLSLLRKYFFGVKNEPLCALCEYRKHWIDEFLMERMPPWG